MILAFGIDACERQFVSLSSEELRPYDASGVVYTSLFRPLFFLSTVNGHVFRSTRFSILGLHRYMPRDGKAVADSATALLGNVEMPQSV